EIGRGVRQVCSLSPTLFNLYLKDLVKNCFQRMGRMTVGGRKIKCIRFSDDKGLLAEEEMILRDMQLELNDICEQYGMKINANKTKTMVFGRKIKRKRSIFCGLLEKELRKKLVKCFVCNVALYGAETWTIGRSEEKRQFEMWIWRRMERVKWTDRMRNEAMLERVGEERMMMKLLIKRKRNWLGHWLRRNWILKDALERMMNGIRNDAVLERVGEERMMLKLIKKRKKELVGPLDKKKLPTEGCTGRNGEREKKISGRERGRKGVSGKERKGEREGGTEKGREEGKENKGWEWKRKEGRKRERKGGRNKGSEWERKKGRKRERKGGRNKEREWERNEGERDGGREKEREEGREGEIKEVGKKGREKEREKGREK
ncbi:hypothetical protein ANN_24999, partial [Periplaneta americana]